MKTHSYLSLSRTLFCAAAGGFTLLIADAQTSDKPTDSEPEKTAETAEDEIATGRVFSVEPAALLVTPANVSIPLNFSYNPKTPLLDEVDKPVLWDQLRAGVPVTVHYITQGEKLVATKVIVTRKMVTGGETTAPSEAARKREMLAEIKKQKDLEATERNKSLPASGGGTIMGFEQVITVRTPDSTDVVQYVVNNSTLYVDTSGQPVPLHLVRTGVPVSIQYVEDAGRRIATQFVVERIPRGAREASAAAASRTGASVPNTAASGTRTGLVPATTIDQNGNVVPANLEEGFVNPPVTVLPGAGQPGQPGAGTGTQPGRPGQPDPNETSAPRNPPQAGTNPNDAQPNQPQRPPAQPATDPTNPQPNTPQPGTRQPGTRPAAQPGTRGNPGTGNPGTSPGSTPGTPAPAR